MRLRIGALTALLLLLLLLIPGAGSAETSWKDILKGLQATGTYADDQIEARIDGGTATIRGKDGASIIGIKDGEYMRYEITPFTVEGVSHYVFENVALYGSSISISTRECINDYSLEYRWDTLDITFGEGTTVFPSVFIFVSNNDESNSEEQVTHAINNGKIYSSLRVCSESGKLVFDNFGVIQEVNIDPKENGLIECVNHGAIGETNIYSSDNGYCKMINEGYTESVFISNRDLSSVELINDGFIQEGHSLCIFQNENDDIGKISITGKGRIGDPPRWVQTNYHDKEELDLSTTWAQTVLANKMLAGLYIEAGQYGLDKTRFVDLRIGLYKNIVNRTEADELITSIQFSVKTPQSGRLKPADLAAKKEMSAYLTEMQTEFDEMAAKNEQVLDELQNVKKKIESLGGLQKGDIVTFGDYEQDNDASNGPEPLEWIVLDVDDETALLLSRYGLDTHILAYGSHELDELFYSGLFNWLNEDFASAAFDKGKLNAIESKPQYRATQWFTVLSKPQIETYFPEAKDRQTKATAHAAAHGAKLSENGYCGWWTCSHGKESGILETYVRGDGTFGEADDHNETIAVRPCFYLNLSCVDRLDDVQRPLAPEPQAEGEYPPAFEIGNVITFGRYEQDNKTSNGMEPIEWRVLAREGNKALLLAQKGLDTQPYHETESVVTWETCTLRAWLNREFYETAFEGAERDAVVLSRIHSNAGNDTDDYVFILSADEATTYLGGGKANRIGGTAYARKRGVYDDGNENAYWWTRTRDEHETGVLVFAVRAFEATGAHGTPDTWSWFYRYADYKANADQIAIRPAIWVDMTADAFTSAGGTTVVASGQSAGRVRIKANGTVNVRKESTKSSERVGRVKDGEEYEYVQVAENGWVQIRLENGELGYVSGNMIEYVD